MKALVGLRGVFAGTRQQTFRNIHCRAAPVGCIRCADKEAVKTDNAAAPLAAYSQAIKANKMVFVGGQLGLDPKTSKFVSDDPAEQTKQAMTNMSAILEAAGTSMDKVIKTTIMMSDIKDFVAINEVYGTFFKDVPPARAAFAAAGLPIDALVEIDAIALQGED